MTRHTNVWTQKDTELSATFYSSYLESDIEQSLVRYWPCHQPGSWRTAWPALQYLCPPSLLSWSPGRRQRWHSLCRWGPRWTWYAGNQPHPGNTQQEGRDTGNNRPQKGTDISNNTQHGCDTGNTTPQKGTDISNNTQQGCDTGNTTPQKGTDISNNTQHGCDTGNNRPQKGTDISNNTQQGCDTGNTTPQ